MKLYKMFESLSQFFAEAIAYIFTPSEGDRYPFVGVQPYEGDPYPEQIDAEA